MEPRLRKMFFSHQIAFVLLVKRKRFQELPKAADEPVSFKMCRLRFKIYQIVNCNVILSPPSSVGRAQGS